MQAIIYQRVSTDEQAESGAGLNAQLDSCRRWAESAKLIVVGPFADEGIGGAAGLDKRPALLEAISAMKKGDVLLVAKRDRLGRDPMVIAMIEAAVSRKGGRIVSAAGEGTDGDNPTDILMRRMVDAFAEYERLIIKARTKAALQSKIKRGERVGSIRYGFELAADGVNLVPVAAEQGIIAWMHDLKADGYSYDQIAKELMARGIPTKNAKTWRAGAVWRILKRAA